LRLFSFGGYGLALAALALVVFGAYDSYPSQTHLPFLEKLNQEVHFLVHKRLRAVLLLDPMRPAPTLANLEKEKPPPQIVG